MAIRILGDYNIIKQLGQGSLGTVYLAEHRFMKKQFALKVLPEELSSDRAFIQRFEDEIKLLSGLDHPHIVKMHNVSFAHGVYFLVTDCIVDKVGESTNLYQYIKEHKKIDEEQIKELLLQVADALDYAHAKGPNFIHRSIKPSNLLLSQSKDGISLHISDFGLSKIIGISTQLTRTYKIVAESLEIVTACEGSIPLFERYSMQLGDSKKLSMLHHSFLQSFAYLAPEQKRIDDQLQVASYSDIYAFGVLAYYLLTGKYPEGVFDLPSEINPSFKYNWNALVLSCLRQNPEKRPQHLSEFLRKKLNLELPFSQKAVKISAEAWEKKEEVQELAAVSVLNYLEVAATSKVEEKSVAEQIQDRIKSEHTVTHYKQETLETKSIEPILSQMVIISGGAYSRGSMSGSRDEMPKHHVHINSFAIDLHPVTNEQFVRFLEFLGDEKDLHNHDIIRLRESRIRRSAGKVVIESGYAKHPVVGVTWYGALAYAKWIGRRLPTEAEWEIASKGGSEEALYPTGLDIEKSEANFFSADTTAVMSYAPNGYGLFDMAGNVYEWCQDWYDYNYYEHSHQEPNEPKGPIQGVYRVLRGGCWKSLKEDLRCSHRHRNNPGTVNRTYGFRCAMDL